MNHLPPMVPLHEVAKELGKQTNVLVSASRRGEFCPIVRVGAVWYVRRDLLNEWFNRQHAVSLSTPESRRWLRSQAGSAAAEPPSPRPPQPRARSASSS